MKSWIFLLFIIISSQEIFSEDCFKACGILRDFQANARSSKRNDLLIQNLNNTISSLNSIPLRQAELALKQMSHNLVYERDFTILHTLTVFTRRMAISMSQGACDEIIEQFEELQTNLTYPILSKIFGPLKDSTRECLRGNRPLAQYSLSSDDLSRWIVMFAEVCPSYFHLVQKLTIYLKFIEQYRSHVGHDSCRQGLERLSNSCYFRISALATTSNETCDADVKMCITNLLWDASSHWLVKMDLQKMLAQIKMVLGAEFQLQMLRNSVEEIRNKMALDIRKLDSYCPPFNLTAEQVGHFRQSDSETDEFIKSLNTENIEEISSEPEDVMINYKLFVSELSDLEENALFLASHFCRSCSTSNSSADLNDRSLLTNDEVDDEMYLDDPKVSEGADAISDLFSQYEPSPDTFNDAIYGSGFEPQHFPFLHHKSTDFAARENNGNQINGINLCQFDDADCSPMVPKDVPLIQTVSSSSKTTDVFREQVVVKTPTFYSSRIVAVKLRTVTTSAAAKRQTLLSVVLHTLPVILNFI